MIANGVKYDEYREIKPYWLKRLVDFPDDFDFKKYPLQHLCNFFKSDDVHFTHVLHNMERLGMKFKKFDSIVFTNGYGKDKPNFEIKNIKSLFMIRTGNEEWGAKPGEKYFTFVVKGIINKNI